MKVNNTHSMSEYVHDASHHNEVHSTHFWRNLLIATAILGIIALMFIIAR